MENTSNVECYRVYLILNSRCENRECLLIGIKYFGMLQGLLTFQLNECE